MLKREKCKKIDCTAHSSVQHSNFPDERQERVRHDVVAQAVAASGRVLSASVVFPTCRGPERKAI